MLELGTLKQCDESLKRVQEVIAMFPTQIEGPNDAELALSDAELRSIDGELKTLKSDIDDRTTRLGVAQDDVSRASARLDGVKQQLIVARQSVETTLPPSGLEEQVASAADAVRSSSNAARQAADAEKAATEDQLAKRTALLLIKHRLGDLRSQAFGARERETAETATLLGQLAGQVQGAPTAHHCGDL